MWTVPRFPRIAFFGMVSLKPSSLISISPPLWSTSIEREIGADSGVLRPALCLVSECVPAWSDGARAVRRDTGASEHAASAAVLNTASSSRGVLRRIILVGAPCDGFS